MVTSPDCHLRAIKGILLYHSQLFSPLCRTAIDLDPPRLLSVNRSNETFFPIDEQRISRLQFIDICLMKMLIVIDRQCDDNIAFILMDLLRFEPSCKGTVVKMRHIEGFPDWFNRERFRPLSFLHFIPFGLLLRLIIFSHSLTDRPLALLIDSPFLCGCLRCRARKAEKAAYVEEGKLKSRKAPFSGIMRQKTLNKIAGRERDAWEAVRQSRSAGRLNASDYIRILFDDFTEFHGDRYYGDDMAVIGGVASFYGMPVTVIGQERGKSPKDSMKHNFGMPSPEGYRKALRLMKQAAKFNRPIICFVDTPGAFPGMEAEERGQGEAIARNLFEMSDMKVPILAIITGQGGSGGALALAVSNEVWMMENATYSILSPEGFASILWKDAKRASEAAKVMKMTAEDLYELGMIERIICEDEPATDDNIEEIGRIIDRHMREFFQSCAEKTPDEIAEQRYERFRKI